MVAEWENTMIAPPKRRNRQEIEPEPTWEVAYLFPAQGMWSEEEYLMLDSNHLIEFSNGYVEVLPMPKTSHQRIVSYLNDLLSHFVVVASLGSVLFAPLRVRLWRNKFREPDVVFMLTKHEDRIGEDYWEGADLVMEVVSPDDPQRDRRIKRIEYAKARIPEYWIVDPLQETITVLRLRGKKYVVHGAFKKGTKATSVLLSGFAVDVEAALAAGQARARKSHPEKRRQT